MMTENSSLSLTTIEMALQRLDRAVLLRLLQPGLSAEVVRSSLESVGLVSSREVELLYGWRNGTSAEEDVTLDDIHIFPGFYLLSIEDAITNYRTFVTDSRWTPGWLPILANGGGDFYVLDMISPEVHPVRHFRIEESDHPIEFDSLKALLATLAEAFLRGVFFVDSNGYLEMNDLAFGELAAELNPAVDWWRE